MNTAACLHKQVLLVGPTAENTQEVGCDRPLDIPFSFFPACFTWTPDQFQLWAEVVSKIRLHELCL